MSEDSVLGSGMPDLSFRHVEKNMLYLAKHILQNIVLFIVKYWFIGVGKFKRWIMPKINSYFGKKEETSTEIKKLSFFKRAILESKAKIKRMKEKVKREQEQKEAVSNQEQ